MFSLLFFRWRLASNGAIESGVHSGEVDNVLTLTLDFVNDPTALVAPRIDFVVALNSHNHKRDATEHIDAEIELFVDGIFIPINSTLGQAVSNSVPLRLGYFDLFSYE